MNAWTKCRGKILLFLTKFGPMTYQSSTTFSFTSTAFADLAWEKAFGGEFRGIRFGDSLGDSGRESPKTR